MVKCKPIFDELLKNFVKLSIQRFSSNVVEKFILVSDSVCVDVGKPEEDSQQSE